MNSTEAILQIVKTLTSGAVIIVLILALSAHGLGRWFWEKYEEADDQDEPKEPSAK